MQSEFSGPDLTDKISGPIRVCLYVMSGDMHFSNHGNLYNQKSIGLHSHPGEADIHFQQFCAPQRVCN